MKILYECTVLIILAGVSSVTLTEENGILTRAQDVKNKTEQSGDDKVKTFLTIFKIIYWYFIYTKCTKCWTRVLYEEITSKVKKWETKKYS